MGKIVILISSGIPNKAASDFRKESILKAYQNMGQPKSKVSNTAFFFFSKLEKFLEKLLRE